MTTFTSDLDKGLCQLHSLTVYGKLLLGMIRHFFIDLATVGPLLRPLVEMQSHPSLYFKSDKRNRKFHIIAV